MEDAAVEEAEVSSAAEFARALVAAHPLGHSFAVAVGPELRVFDLKAGCAVLLSDDSGGGSHSDAIRAISFSADCVLFASAGDDKLVKVWKTDSWCIHPDYKFSPDGWFICTADRDFKIRVTLFPKNPIKGAHEIQSFCLGHTDLVSCIALTGLSEGPSFLLSGGGDSIVHLWDYINGCLLDTCQVRDKVGGLLEPNETEDSNLAVADICLTNDGSLVAVAIQGLNGVMLLTCDLIAKKLSFLKVITMEKSYIPTSLASSFLSDLLRTVMGASNMPNQAASQLLTRLRIIPCFQKDLLASSDQGPAILEDSEVPHGEKLLLALKGSLDIAEQEEVLASVLAALKVSMHKMLAKNYSEERRESRGRGAETIRRSRSSLTCGLNKNRSLNTRSILTIVILNLAIIT